MNAICLLLSNCHTSKKITTQIYTGLSADLNAKITTFLIAGFYKGCFILPYISKHFCKFINSISMIYLRLIFHISSIVGRIINENFISSLLYFTSISSCVFLQLMASYIFSISFMKNKPQTYMPNRKKQLSRNISTKQFTSFLIIRR